METVAPVVPITTSFPRALLRRPGFFLVEQPSCMCLRRCSVTESPAGPRYSLCFSERRREYVLRRIEIAGPSFGCEPRPPPFCVAAFRFGRKWAAEPQEEREVMGRLLFIVAVAPHFCPETLGVRFGVHSLSGACRRDM